jgi:hypothetical protein
VSRLAGHGLEVSGSCYENFEPHPDTNRYPTLWRAKFEGKTLEVPADACEEAKDKVGLKYVEIRYFEVDMQYKGLRVLGAVDVPAESTDSNPPGGGYAVHPLSEEHGGWQWHIRKKNDFQLELNADNSVLRGVDFNARSVMEGGDITGLMAFHFPRNDNAAHGKASLERQSLVTPQPPIHLISWKLCSAHHVLTFIYNIRRH